MGLKVFPENLGKRGFSMREFASGGVVLSSCDEDEVGGTTTTTTTKDEVQ